MLLKKYIKNLKDDQWYVFVDNHFRVLFFVRKGKNKSKWKDLIGPNFLNYYEVTDVLHDAICYDLKSTCHMICLKKIKIKGKKKKEKELPIGKA